MAGLSAWCRISMPEGGSVMALRDSSAPVCATLRDVTACVYIVAYREDVGELQRALSGEGLRSVVIRPHYSEEERGYSAIVRCLLNHRNAWRECAASQALNMIVEADFVPVRGFARLPVPFDLNRQDRALGWLYACGPVLYDLDDQGYARGHAAAPVATLLGARTAGVLLEFAEAELSSHDPRDYIPFDTHIRVYLQQRGINSYLPWRHYGEHGGIPNPEHRTAGVAATHRADRLYGRLHFLPAYARGSRMRYRGVRLQAWLRGLGRLVLARYVHPRDILRHQGWRRRLGVVWYSVTRLFMP